MELKAYKLLAQLRGSALSAIQHNASNKTQYCKDDTEEIKKWLEYIGNPGKWDYCGILSKKDKKVLETLEYLVNDDREIK